MLSSTSEFRAWYKKQDKLARQTLSALWKRTVGCVDYWSQLDWATEHLRDIKIAASMSGTVGLFPSCL